MPPRRGRLVAITLGLIIISPARAESLDTAAKQLYAGIAVVSAAAVVGVIFLVRHEKHRPLMVTGCVAAEASGMSLKDARDGQVYALSGVQENVRAGEKMTLTGRRRGGVFEVRSVAKDMGACQP